jgi:hypothetical protein
MNKPNRYKKMAGLLGLVALLAGCATATPYQPLGYPGASGGYSDMQLDQNHWRVSFTGNTVTTRQQVETYLLYRAAELTLQQGFNCFTLVNRATDRSVELRVNPYGPGYGYGYGYYPGWAPYWRMGGPWGWHYYDPWFGGPFFPGSYDIDTIVSFEASADIALSRGPCPAEPGTFDAAQVVQNLNRFIVPPRQR